MMIITDEEHRQQVEAFEQYRHRLERKPNERQQITREAWPLRVAIDAKLADMKDEAFIAKMMDYEG